MTAVRRTRLIASLPMCFSRGHARAACARVTRPLLLAFSLLTALPGGGAAAGVRRLQHLGQASRGAPGRKPDHEPGGGAREADREVQRRPPALPADAPAAAEQQDRAGRGQEEPGAGPEAAGAEPDQRVQVDRRGRRVVPAGVSLVLRAGRPRAGAAAGQRREQQPDRADRPDQEGDRRPHAPADHRDGAAGKDQRRSWRPSSRWRPACTRCRPASRRSAPTSST